MIRIIAGIDYSLTCPAICITENQNKDEFSFYTTNHHFRSNLHKFSNFSENGIKGENHGNWKTDEDRYDDIANWAMLLLKDYGVNEVFLEGYSYGSTGRVFHIAENTAILKYLMWDEDIKFTIVPPTVIKKFATGKGNAPKDVMLEAFLKENPGVDLPRMLTPKSSKVISPVSDIVDAYFICKYGMYTKGPAKQ